jgi:nucleotide-binding universal stress UspA family protein
MLVVGYDGSDGARRALDAAIELARGLGDGLVLAFASQPPGRQVGDEYRAHLAALEDRGREVLAEGLAHARAAGIEAEGEIDDLKPVDLLIGLAERRGARMIVVGSHAESPLRGAVLGSAPHKLLQLSPVPVLTVPAG